LEQSPKEEETVQNEISSDITKSRPLEGISTTASVPLEQTKSKEEVIETTIPTTSTKPVIPALPLSRPKQPIPTEQGNKPNESKVNTNGDTPNVDGQLETKVEQTSVKAVAKSWAELVRSKNPVNLQSSSVNATSHTMDSMSNKTSNSLAEVLNKYQVESHDKVSFVEPRGLVNTGNMCYMNSVRISSRYT